MIAQVLKWIRRWPIEDRIGWSVLVGGGLLTWAAIALIGGLALVTWVLGAGVWLSLVAIGGLTGGGQ